MYSGVHFCFDDFTDRMCSKQVGTSEVRTSQSDFHRMYLNVHFRNTPHSIVNTVGIAERSDSSSAHRFDRSSVS